MNPPFDQIDNVYRPSAIVQLPKIYTHRTSSNLSVNQMESPDFVYNWQGPKRNLSLSSNHLL